MENARKIRVAITHGDINGIGYEVVLKVFADPAMFDICTPIIYGSSRVASFHRKALGLTTNFNTIDNAEDAVDGKLNLVSCFDEEVKVDFGQATRESGHAALVALDRAMADYANRAYDVLVTAPVCKWNMQGEGSFIGHTEYLEQRLGGEALMILSNGLMRVALASTHVPVSQIAEVVTQDVVENKLRLLNASLCRDYLVSAPRIAVLALNPHAGDNGLLGNEESERIAPAIAKLREEGMGCFGPYAADGFFGDAAYRRFDAVLAMYHDQGLAPLKALGMAQGVNFTAGLDMVRTSPDHGTAFDIAGKNTADESSMRQAIYEAIDIYRNRLKYDEAHADPLKVEQRDRREDNASR
jgi:4-hydroxythreonine-4-phosphate dehydrogenase